MTPLSRRAWLAALASLAAGGGGCDGGASGGPGPITSAAHGERELVVFAAASLRVPFGALAARFEAEHPGVAVRLSFAGSQALRTQIEQGAPADVFASADEAHARALVDAGRAGAPRVFAENELVIVVSKERAGDLRSVADLARAERVVVGGPEVPVGRYAAAFLERARAELGSDFPARVEARVRSRELDVGHVLAKVRLGEADAGVVYLSDARAAGEAVATILVPPSMNVVARYPVVILRGARAPTLAAAWVATLLGPPGREALVAAGLRAPAEGP